MIFAVDTNVLLDVLLEDEEYSGDSEALLEEKSGQGFFIISPEVYSELVAAFAVKFDEPQEELDQFMEQKGIVLEHHEKDSLVAAGKAWEKYDSSPEVKCPGCGQGNSFKCGSCGERVSWRNHLITDFLIGGHAEVKSDILITRDRGYFSRYFEVEILDPAAEI